MNHPLDDIVFEGRNQHYGAYALRKEYTNNVFKSTLIGSGLFVLAVCLPQLFNQFGAEKRKIVVVDVIPELLPPIEETKKAELPIPEKTQIQAPVVKQVEFLPPVVQTTPLEDVPPPTIEQYEGAAISDKTTEGIEDHGILTPPVETVGKGKETLVDLNTEPETVEIYRVEHQPAFPGGQEALQKYLRKNLRYPAQASRAGIQGKVFLQFVIMPDGRIEGVEVLKGIGFGCDEEAARVVKLMPKWEAGMQSGRKVKVRFSLPIQFALMEN